MNYFGINYILHYIIWANIAPVIFLGVIPVAVIAGVIYLIHKK